MRGKRHLFYLMMMVLLFILFVCASRIEPDANVPTSSTTETDQSKEMLVDYSVFCGNYSDAETVEGPCYAVSIINVDNTTKAIEIEISYVGDCSSPVYVTETIAATVKDDHTVEFAWTDSWTNRGVGTLILNPDDTLFVQLMMTVTEEAEVNRATLSTGDQYKTLIRRQDAAK